MVAHSMKVSSMPLSIIAIIQASDFFLCSIVIVMSSYFFCLCCIKVCYFMSPCVLVWPAFFSLHCLEPCVYPCKFSAWSISPISTRGAVIGALLKKKNNTFGFPAWPVATGKKKSLKCKYSVRVTQCVD